MIDFRPGLHTEIDKLEPDEPAVVLTASGPYTEQLLINLEAMAAADGEQEAAVLAGRLRAQIVRWRQQQGGPTDEETT